MKKEWYNKIWFRISLVSLFAIAMAYLESVLVIYLREINAFLQHNIPENPELIFKLPFFALMKNPLDVISSYFMSIN